MVKIDESVTEAQRADPRFCALLADSEALFNSPQNRLYLLKLGCHEAGHIIYARRAGATDIQRHGPTMYFDSRPQYDKPAISRSSVSWTPPAGASVVANMKAFIAGYICRRELSEPNDAVAVEMDVDSAREWFDKNIGTGNEAFMAAITKAEAEILTDLKSQSVVDEIWAEAKRFVEHIFPKPAKKKHIKIGRNELCFCGSGKKYKKCHIAVGLPESPAIQI